jgi:hypothetical protein
MPTLSSLSITLAAFASIATGAIGTRSLTIAGRVLDPDGKPCAGAQVFLGSPILSPPFGTHMEARGASDARGAFALDVPQAWIDRRGYKRLTLWAWKPGLAVAAAMYEADDVPVGRSIDVTLGPPARSPLEVVGPDGKPLAGARVRPRSFELGEHSDVPPPELVEELVFTTDDQGRTSVDAWPLASVNEIDIASDAFGVQELKDFTSRSPSWSRGRAELKPIARLLVRIEGEPPAESAGAVHVRVRSMAMPPMAADQRSISSYVSCTLAGDTGPDGRLVLAPVLAGGCQVEIRCPPSALVRPTCGNIKLEADRDNELAITWKKGMLVQGRIVTGVDKHPVANARLRWFQYPIERCELVTDGDGRFSVGAFGGFAEIEEIAVDPPAVGVPDFGRYRYQLPSNVERHELATIELAAGVSIPGTVRGADEKPVGGAWVCAHWRSGGNGRTIEYRTTTLADERGRFTLDAIEDGASIQVSARFADSSTLQPVTATASASLPLELRLVPADRIALRGRVTDEHGRPIAGANVEVWQESPENVIGGEKRVGTGALRTAPDGRFVSARELSPESSYSVLVESEGMLARRTLWARMSSSSDVEVTLKSLARVEGTVRDAYDKPVAGARVFVRDAPAACESATDERGHFVLDGVVPGTAVLFVQSGDAPAVVRVIEAPCETLSCTLASEPEASSAALRTLEPPITRVRELEIAWSIVEPRAERAIESKKSSDICRALEDTAWIDSGYALARVEQGVLDSFLSGVVRARVVDALLERAPDDAALVSSLQQPFSRAIDLARIASALPAEQHARKLELLSEAAVEATQAGAPEYELCVYARVAAVLFDAGEQDAARKILERGLPIVDKLPAHDWPSYARCSFAEVWAHFDLDRALAIVAEDKDPLVHQRHYGNMARRLAASDPAAAERVWEAFRREPRGYVASWLPGLCYAMAGTDLARARRLALEGGGSQGAFALGMIALAIARTDHATASDLLEQAFRVLAARAARDDDGNESIACPVVGGALLPIVEVVDVTRVREFMNKALALRLLRTTGARITDEQLPYLSDAGLAMFVARYDRALARTLLQPAVEFAKLRPTYFTNQWGETTLPAALALTDPDWAVEVAKNVLPERAQRTVALVLARTGEARWRFVQDTYANLWVVGKEDL